MKHRPARDSRVVPACPDLVQVLGKHLDQFGPGLGGRLFVTRTGRFGPLVSGPYSNPVSTNTYTRAWRRARDSALTPAQVDFPLAARPYDLRHACVSLWLNAGVPAPQVAEWAGHSVHVLMRAYAKCVHGQEEAARRRIEAVLGTHRPVSATLATWETRRAVGSRTGSDVSLLASGARWGRPRWSDAVVAGGGR